MVVTYLVVIINSRAGVHHVNSSSVPGPLDDCAAWQTSVLQEVTSAEVTTKKEKENIICTGTETC